MTKIYSVILKRHGDNRNRDVCIFYDEDREVSIAQMQKYVKKNGFTINEKGNVFSIGDVILREKYATGELISEKTYRQIFDCFGNREKGEK